MKEKLALHVHEAPLLRDEKLTEIAAQPTTIR